MKLYLNHKYKYAVEQIILVLFPNDKPEYSEIADYFGNYCISELTEHDDVITAKTTLCIDNISNENSRTISCTECGQFADEIEKDRILQRIIKQTFYNSALPFLDEAPKWGALTGVSPVKLILKEVEKNHLSIEEAFEIFKREYFVSDSRAKLAIEAAKCGLAAKRSLQPDEISLYIGIPFCPTRCAYCSFVSADIKHTIKLIDPFLDALLQEIDTTSRLLNDAKIKLRTIYIGGGTPTTLNCTQLEILLQKITNSFDLSRLSEFTVEAGRPDTITLDKMLVLKRFGVGRVSVNPQSMNDNVLKAMGREHKASDILSAYKLVREADIDIVNMDLIAGLPEDNIDSFKNTLDTVIELAPENITVHTLALKKGSRLMAEAQKLPSAQETSAMLDYAWSRLKQIDYIPYYLYRQKYMTGSLENVGWCKRGCEGLYNICIMEELHTILALGAGGSSKLTDGATGKIIRQANPKYPKEYIERINSICDSKADIISICAKMLGKQLHYANILCQKICL